MPMTQQETAEKSSAALDANDAASRALGIVLTAVAPGQATVTMPVTADKLNGHGICHGGLIFTLADTAFAHAHPLPPPFERLGHRLQIAP